MPEFLKKYFSFCSVFKQTKAFKYNDQSLYKSVINNNYNVLMKLSKYISIPHSSRTQPSVYYRSNYQDKDNFKYLSCFQILISLLTAIIVLNFRIINSYVIFGDLDAQQTKVSDQISSLPSSQNSEYSEETSEETKYNLFDVIYPFSLTLVFKLIIVVNYWYREKPVGRLAMMAKISVFDLFIPGFLKSMYYVSMMIATMYFESTVFIMVLVLSAVGIQVLNCKLYKRKKMWMPPNLLNNTTDNAVSSTNSTSRFKYRFPFRDILTAIFLLISICLCGSALTKVQELAQYSQFAFGVDELIKQVTIILVVTICMISYFYFHSRIFELYELEVDELISKEYVVEIFNIIVIGSIYYFYLFMVQALQSSKSMQVDDDESRSFTSRFLFCLEYPIHTLVGLCTTILYEYLCFEMLKKQGFKALFLSQLGSIFWINIFCIAKNQYGGFSLTVYALTLSSFVGMLCLLRIFNLLKCIRFLANKINSKKGPKKNKKRQKNAEGEKDVTEEYEQEQK